MSLTPSRGLGRVPPAANQPVVTREGRTGLRATVVLDVIGDAFDWPNPETFIADDGNPTSQTSRRRQLLQLASNSGAGCVTAVSVHPGLENGWAAANGSVQLPPGTLTSGVSSVPVLLVADGRFHPREEEIVAVSVAPRCLEQGSVLPAWLVSIMPPPPAETIARDAETGLGVVGLIAAVITAVTPTTAPTVMFVAPQADAVLELAACREDRDSFPPWQQHPLQFSLGDGAVGGSMGAVVGNTVLLLLALVLHWAGAEAYVGCTNAGRAEAYAATAVPLAGVFVAAIFVYSTALHATRIIAHGVNFGWQLVGVLILLIWMLPLVAILLALTRFFAAIWVPPETPGTNLSGDAGTDANAPSETAASKSQRDDEGVWKVFTEPGHWRISAAYAALGGDFVLHFGGLFRFATERGRWVFLWLMVLTLCAGIVVGSRPLEGGECGSQRVALLIVAAVELVAAAALRPCRSVFNTAVLIVLPLAVAIGALIVAMGTTEGLGAGLLPAVALVLCLLASLAAAAGFFVLQPSRKGLRPAQSSTSALRRIDTYVLAEEARRGGVEADAAAQAANDSEMSPRPRHDGGDNGPGAAVPTFAGSRQPSGAMAPRQFDDLLAAVNHDSDDEDTGPVGTAHRAEHAQQPPRFSVPQFRAGDARREPSYGEAGSPILPLQRMLSVSSYAESPPHSGARGGSRRRFDAYDDPEGSPSRGVPPTLPAQEGSGRFAVPTYGASFMRQPSVGGFSGGPSPSLRLPTVEDELAAMRQSSLSSARFAVPMSHAGSMRRAGSHAAFTSPLPVPPATARPENPLQRLPSAGNSFAALSRDRPFGTTAVEDDGAAAAGAYAGAPLKPLEAFGMREFFSRSPPRQRSQSPRGAQRPWFDEGSSFFGAGTSTGGKSITDDVETLGGDEASHHRRYADDDDL